MIVLSFSCNFHRVMGASKHSIYLPHHFDLTTSEFGSKSGKVDICSYVFKEKHINC